MDINHIQGPVSPEQEYRNRIRRVRDERVKTTSADDRVAISNEARTRQVFRTPLERPELISSLRKKFGIESYIDEMSKSPDKTDEILGRIADKVQATYSSDSGVNEKIAEGIINDITA